MEPYALIDQETPVLLAPMSGVTDAPFRKQVMKFGASVTITEMVAGDELRANGRDAKNRLKIGHYPGKHIVQLIGREELDLEYGAIRAREAGADVIDINMGCPARRVTGGHSGSALMRDLDRAESLIKAVLKGAKHIPVTLKMRLGWDEQSLNAAELAIRAEKLGVQLVTVHGRTRQQFYEGKANWAAVKSVVDCVTIPVLVNGDISDLSSAQQALNDSGAYGVMIGRAAIGKAWLINWLTDKLNGRKTTIPTLEQQVESLIEQAEDSVMMYGERVGVRTVRKHLSEAIAFWNTSGQVQISNETRVSVLKAQTLADLQMMLKSIALYSAEHV